MRYSSAILSLAFALKARAQIPVDSLPVGARVQVHGVTATPTGDRSYFLQGRIVGGDPRHLVISRDSGATVDTLPFFAMTSLQLNDGQVTRNQLVAGATLTGAGVGAAAYLTALVLQNANGGDMWKTAQRISLASIPILAGAGLIIGSVSSTEKWVSVRIPGAFLLPRR